MPRDVKYFVKGCVSCRENAVRRAHLVTQFQNRKLEDLPMPRQNYGIDFYGVEK